MKVENIIDGDFSMFETDAIQTFDKYLENHVSSMKTQAEYFAFNRNEIANAKVTKSAMETTIYNYGHHISNKKINVLLFYVLPAFESIFLGACGVFSSLYFGGSKMMWHIIVAIVTFFLFLICLLFRIMKVQK